MCTAAAVVPHEFLDANGLHAPTVDGVVGLAGLVERDVFGAAMGLAFVLFKGWHQVLQTVARGDGAQHGTLDIAQVFAGNGFDEAGALSHRSLGDVLQGRIAQAGFERHAARELL